MSLFKSTTSIRLFTAFISLVFIAGMFSSCGKPTGTVAPNPNSSDTYSSGQNTDGLTNAPMESEAPLTAQQLFVEGVKQVLINAATNSEKLVSANLDLLLNPGIQLQQSKANYTKSTINLVNPQEGSENLTVSIESILDAASGDASSEISIQSGSEVAQRGGVYFTGDTMLIKSANVEKQMIQHTMDPAVAKSLQSQPALARYTHVLESSTEEKLGEDGWVEAIDAFIGALQTQAAESDFTTSEESVMLAGNEVGCTASTLALSAEQASSVTREFVALIQQDPSFQSLFVTRQEAGEDTYGITGLDGVLRDLGALQQNELTLKFKLIQTDRPVGLRIYTAGQDMSFFMEFLFYENGYTRQNNIVFRGFDGSSVTIQDVNTNTSGDNYEGQVLYEAIAPGNIPQEKAVVNTQGTIGKSGADLIAQMSYNLAASNDNDAMAFTGEATYVQKNSATGTTSLSTGTITVTSDDETSTIKNDMTLEQSDTPHKVNAPEFLPAAGVSTSDEAGLYAALGTVDKENFSRTPLTTRMLGALMLLFI